MLKKYRDDELIGKKVYVEGGNTERKRIVEAIYVSFGATIVQTITDEIDIYCLISPIAGNYCNVTSDFYNMENAQHVIEKMESRKAGKFILISNNMGADHVVGARWAKEEAMQASIIQWWKSMASRAAKSGVRGNIICLGYGAFWENKLDDIYEERILRILSVKRFAVEKDLKCALYYLSTNESSYVVGEILKLDGGLHRRSIIDVKGYNGTLPDKEFELGGRKVLIVGASSGMGRSVARKLSIRGAKVLLSSRNESALLKLKKEIVNEGGSADVYKLDVTNKEECKRVMDRIYQMESNIDGIVYASGLYQFEKFYKNNEIWEPVMNTNFNGFVEITNSYINKCIELKCNGVMVAIASVATDTVPLANSEAYVASKAAMKHFVESISLSYARNGIRMNCVAPGCTDTPMIAQVSDEYRKMWLECIPSRRLGTPDDVAGTVAYLVSDASAYINGETIKVDGGFSLGNLDFFEKDIDNE